jgi:two-component system, cell cycle sensor histidine kinase PleC
MVLRGDSFPEEGWTGTRPLRRPTVAIVDDRITNLKILERLAASLDDRVDVRTFDHPKRALDYARNNPPDLVITDFKMPDLDGAEFIRRFRQLLSCADVPVMVITAYEDRDLRYQALEAGATDFLLSPVDHHEFRVRSRNLLTMRRQ